MCLISILETLFTLFKRNSCKMNTVLKVSLTPVGVRGMKVLERDKFLRNIEVPTLLVPGTKLAQVTKICKPYFLKLENFKPIQPCLNSEIVGLDKCIHLNPENISNWTDISEVDRTALKQHEVNENNFKISEIHLCYDNWKIDTIFKAVLPENNEIISSFSQIGHIIHLNLKDHLLEYRKLIGEVLLDKLKTCRTVVNKSNVIDNTYRNFSMEILAGEEDFLVTVKENQCIFQFDFSKVYWNPRLGKEHERILTFLQPGDILFDVFCGVGPFAVPVAKKKKCKVFANDLNPESYKWLNHNAKKNKVNLTHFKSYNQDGKDFIRNIFKEYIISYCKGTETLKSGAKIHITMNLPALAVEFLKHFKNLISETELADKFDCEVIIYLYCFVIGEDLDSCTKQLVNEKFGSDISDHIMDIFNVRNVSPKKEMMRVTIKLTKDIIFNVDTDYNDEPPVKKMCLIGKDIV